MDLAELLALQSGVISRRQALEQGMKPHDIRRLIRRREWATVHPGVYVNHTGPLTWQQRAWAAVLAMAPAALSDASALGSHDGPVHVAVDRSRTVVAPDGVIRHYLADLDRRVQWNASPPRVRIEYAVLARAAAATDDFAAMAALAQPVQSRRTTAGKLLDALEQQQRVARRPFLVSVLGDIEAGSCSVLEQGYLERVERRHGLPVASRQVAAASRGRIYRDVDYPAYGLVIELDGRLFHDSTAARDRDLDRDLDAAVDGRLTVRLGWGQVFGRSCETAARVGLLLEQRGWNGEVRPCPECATPQP